MSVQPPNPPQQPPYQPPQIPIQPLSPQEERTWGMLCHLSALSGYVVPAIGWILGPLICWLLKKDASPFVDDQGKESLNFQISCLIYSIIAALSIFVLVGFVLLPAVAIFCIVEVILASVAANNGRAYRYPLTIRFIS